PAKSRPGRFFDLAEIDADVPTIAGLCDGAMVCGRSRGFPARQQFRPLATGLYANPDELGEALDRNDEEGALILLLETWPNALGTMALLPGNTFQPPESMMIDNALTMMDRVLSFGFSVRSLNETGRGNFTGDWVGYARSNATDLRALTGLMQMAEVRLTPANIEGVAGRVETTVLPDRDVAGSYYAIYDPVASTGEWGWAVLADGDDRLRWLAGLEHDDGSAPLIYLEIADLWRLFSVAREFREEFGFAQSWMSRRWVRAQVSATAAGPRVRMAMGKL
ncbi:MAG: hypothetical protein KC457_33540, partial [Myxococcales bacterium]|nr:hypothetical protein [Myxococcales bacterium]